MIFNDEFIKNLNQSETFEKQGLKFRVMNSKLVKAIAKKKRTVKVAVALSGIVGGFSAGYLMSNTFTNSSNEAIVKTSNEDEKEKETIKEEEYQAKVKAGTEYDAIDQIEENLENFIDHDFSMGVYNIDTEDQTVVVSQVSEAFENTYSAYIFANLKDYFNNGKVLRSLGEAYPNIDDAQEYINSLDEYASVAGLPDNLIDLFSNNTDRNFMKKFKDSIEKYESGNKKAFYQFLIDYENGKYDEVSPYVRMMMMGLATSHKSTYDDKCWDEHINIGKTEDGTVKRKDWYYYQRTTEKCEGMTDKAYDRMKEVSSLNSTVYTQTVERFDAVKDTLALSTEKYSNIQTRDELKESIVKSLSEKYAIGTEANKAAHDAYYRLWKEILNAKIGETTRTIRTGKSHVVSSKITKVVSKAELVDEVKPDKNEHKEVKNDDTNNKTIVTEDVYKGETYTQDEITQRGYKDAFAIINKYMGGPDIRENLKNLKAHRYDYNLSGLDSKYHATYKLAFNEVMNESIQNLEKAVNTIFPDTFEPTNGDEVEEIVDTKTEESDETITGPTVDNNSEEETKNETTEDSKKEEQTENKTTEDSKKEEQTENKTTEESKKEEQTENKTTEDSKKEEQTKNETKEESKKEENKTENNSGLIPVPGSSYDEDVEDDKGVIVDTKVEESEETIISYKQASSNEKAKTTTTATKTATAKTTSSATEQSRLKKINDLKKLSEAVKQISSEQKEVQQTQEAEQISQGHTK